MRYCQSCGQANQDDAQFCEKCGSSLAGAAQQGAPKGAQPSAAPQVDVSTIVSQGKNAVGGVVNKFGVVGIAAAVVGVLVLVLVWTFFFKPMDATAYEDGVYDGIMDISDGMSDVNQAFEQYRVYYNDYDRSEKLDGEDWKATKAEVDEHLKEIKGAAKKMKGMRPPKEYKSEGRRVDTYVNWVLEDYVAGVESIFDEVEAGARYEAVSRKIERAEAKSSERSSKAYRDLYRATEKLGISDYGEY